MVTLRLVDQHYVIDDSVQRRYVANRDAQKLNPRYSRHLRTLMREAGFERTQGVAHAPKVYGDAANTRWMAELLADNLGSPGMSEVIVSEGWAGRIELDAVMDALRQWGEQPDAFAAWLYCGALG